MPTPAQEAFAEGFSALSEVHDPQKSWTFGGASFAGVQLQLQHDDPRMVGAGDRVLVIEVSTAALPTPTPTRGEDLMRGGKAYRVTRLPDVNAATGRTTFILAP